MNLKNISAVQIGLASPEQILEWSKGEVTKPETINYRTLKPEKDGLFCERIFGPTKDYECSCGKYKRSKMKDKNKICEKCGVEVTRSSVRRERMGHIQLAAPVSHIWYTRGSTNRMATLLQITNGELEDVLYFIRFIVLDPGKTELKKLQLINDEQKNKLEEKYGVGSFRVGMGAEAVKELLQELDLEAISVELKEKLKKMNEKEAAKGKSTTSQNYEKATKYLDIVENFRLSNNKPEWMIMDVLPVMPPDLRPLVQLEGGRFATSDLNDLYRRIINRNNRLKKLIDTGAPNIIIRNEKRMLQEAVDALIDNGRRGKSVTGASNRALKGLSDLLRGKQGRFRQNLLGKRVDYSGRSVIVVGPELKLYQCGLPKEMALELFKPFVMQRLIDQKIATQNKSAKRMVERAEPKVWDVLEEVIKEHPVLLNRAPTLHRLGIQAFEPVLVEGKAMKLHPLTCTAYNADFDGDQMAVHVPLSMEAQAEASFLMLAHNNILKPQDGKPVISPNQDMVIGCYYLTMEDKNALGAGRVFADFDEAMMAYSAGNLSLQAPIKVRISRTVNGQELSKVIDCTLGLLIFNEIIPQDIGMVERNTIDDVFKLEVNKLCGKKVLNQIVDLVYQTHGVHETAKVLDDIKTLGYHYSTRGAVTVSVADIIIPKEKQEILDKTDEIVKRTNMQFRRGMLTEDERYRIITQSWTQATNELKKKILPQMDTFNPIRIMTDSGARGSEGQLNQLAGMRGLMASPSGKAIELPIRSNFSEGLSALEFFISSHGSRKSLADTALRTADSGYLTRRLVDVAQEIIVREYDCFENRKKPIRGKEITAIKIGDSVIETLEERMIGRVASKDICYPDSDRVIVGINQMITHKKAKEIVAAGITSVEVRSPLTCMCKHGVCSKCYGMNLATGNPVDIGEAVGIIAAQAIGEPGTQLTMRTFHSGGVASGEDITQGLPRVEELFEARKPKYAGILTDISGYVSIVNDSSNSKIQKVIVKSEDGKESQEYIINFGLHLKVEDGQFVEAGDPLTEGSIYPQDILRILGPKHVQDYILREVLSVYRQQGVGISDKHIEVIVSQMMRKVKISSSGDTNFVPNELVDANKFDQVNTEMLLNGKTPASGKAALLGITKASLATESFLAAAAFQETTKVLTDAAIKSKVDKLVGLKENVIIGRLIPAGTGISLYKDIEVQENF